MIIGLGNDLVDIRRIEALLKRHGRRFPQKVFCGCERALAAGRGQGAAAALAGRFAAKEAAAKALGSGFRDGVGWRDICVETDGLRAPLLRLSGGARARLEKITPAGFRAQLHLALTDEYPYAHAVVIIEGRREVD